MPLSPLERKAAFAYAATMRGKTKTAAAKEDLGVTWTHLAGVLSGERYGSAELWQRFAEYVGKPVRQVRHTGPLVSATPTAV